ncbi:hypothetical protein EB093_07700 [bacterium]|nr:hypothetical protein [bacterium]
MSLNRSIIYIAIISLACALTTGPTVSATTIVLYPPDLALVNGESDPLPLANGKFSIGSIPSGSIPAYFSVNGSNSMVVLDGFIDTNPPRPRTVTIAGATPKSKVSWSAVISTLASTIGYILEGNGTQSTLSAQVTIYNRSDTPFTPSKIQIKIGDPLLRDLPQPGVFMKTMTEMPRGPMADDFSYFYDVDTRVTIAPNQIAVVPIFGPLTVKEKIIYQFIGNHVGESDTPIQLDRQIMFKNTTNHALAPGNVRVIRNGQLISIGTIGGIPLDGDVRISTGRSLEVTGTRKVIGRTVDGVREDTIDVTLANASVKPVAIEVIESAWGNASILRASQPYTRVGANRYLFPVTLAAKQSVTVQFVVRYQP